MKKKCDIEKIINKKGCFSGKENQEIYLKYFQKIPKYLYHNLGKYGLDKKKVLDVGCGFGNHLIHFGEGSVGLDANPKHIEFLKAIGLKNQKINIEENFEIDELFDTVWCSNILEHLIAPHMFLRKVHYLLENNGLLFVYCPVKTFWPIDKIGQGKGFLASEHVNFFTKETLKLTIESAGFKILEVNSAFFYNKLLNNLFSKLILGMSPGITVVAVKDSKFNYSQKRIDEFRPKWAKL
jgi:SAM-dependent methyltransferase